MTDLEPTFAELIERVKDGSEEAARQLLDQFQVPIYRVIRRKLVHNHRLRQQFDSDDFYQAVLKSFFANRQTIGRFTNLDALLAFLATMAGNKVIDECRRSLLSQKRNASRNHSLHDAETRDVPQLASAASTPSEIVSVREQLERLTAGQPEVYQQIVKLRGQNMTYDEIGAELDMHPGSVRRILGKLIQRVAQ